MATQYGFQSVSMHLGHMLRERERQRVTERVKGRETGGQRELKPGRLVDRER